LTLKVEHCTHEDFLDILSTLEEFWGDAAERARRVHHPMFVHEFADTAWSFATINRSSRTSSASGLRPSRPATSTWSPSGGHIRIEDSDGDSTSGSRSWPENAAVPS
jgi:hypothetical protein